MRGVWERDFQIKTKPISTLRLQVFVGDGEAEGPSAKVLWQD